MRRLIISDIHLGSDLNRAEGLMKVLSTVIYDQLIILGDLFDHHQLYRLRREDWRFIDYLNSISGKKEVVWVEGNHDEELFNVIPSLFGIKALKEFEWVNSGKKFLAIHGHQFDYYYLQKSLLPAIAGGIYRYLMKTEKQLNMDFLDRISRNNKSWIKSAETVGKRAIEYALAKKADYVFCGHTHRATRLIRKKVTYVNTGCWQDMFCHFVMVDKTRVELNMYVPKQESWQPNLTLQLASY